MSVKTKKKKNRGKTVLIVLGIFLAVLAALTVWALDSSLGVSKYTVSSPEIPLEFDGYKILQITDLHCERFGKNQSGLTARIDALAPDIVVFTGDIMDENILDFEPAEELCAALSEKYRILNVWGNHDRWLSNKDFRHLKEIYAEYGVETLQDTTVLVEKNGAKIAFSGCDDPPYWGRNDLGFVEENGIGVSPAQGYYNILLYHRANIFPYLREQGFDLVLSGHMHGGQARIPFVGGVISPTMQWFPDYTAGRYFESGTTMIVGRGLGNAVRVPRVFNPPELVLITLKTGE